MGSENLFAVFTKPWPDWPIGRLAQSVKKWGFDGIEFPLRQGFQVEPERAEQALPALVHVMAEEGVKVLSVASRTDERVFAACAKSGVPMIRTMAAVGDEGYKASELDMRRHLEQLLPWCERYGVLVGIQEHYGAYVSSALGLRSLLQGFDPRKAAAVFDAAHDALTGMAPEYGLEIIWPHLAMVNLKNVYYYRTNGPEAEEASWSRHFTSGRQGMASWSRIAAYLERHRYTGPICLTAEYSDISATERLIAEDLRYARSLFHEGSVKEEAR